MLMVEAYDIKRLRVTRTKCVMSAANSREVHSELPTQEVGTIAKYVPGNSMDVLVIRIRQLATQIPVETTLYTQHFLCINKAASPIQSVYPTASQ
jgi:hypothetical protein